MSQSEIAELRKKIDLECQAMKQGLTGLAIVAKHQIIDNKYEQLGKYQDQLSQQIGVTAALEVVIASLNQWGNDASSKQQNEEGVRHQ